jgi:hypothetical protein
VLGKSPKGFKVERSEIRGVEDNCVGGWAHELAPNHISMARLVFPASFEDASMFREGSSKRGVVGGGKKAEAEGGRESEEVVVSSEGGGVPDHLSRRKDITLLLRSCLIPPRLSIRVIHDQADHCCFRLLRTSPRMNWITTLR